MANVKYFLDRSERRVKTAEFRFDPYPYEESTRYPMRLLNLSLIGLAISLLPLSAFADECTVLGGGGTFPDWCELTAEEGSVAKFNVLYGSLSTSALTIEIGNADGLDAEKLETFRRQIALSLDTKDSQGLKELTGEIDRNGLHFPLEEGNSLYVAFGTIVAVGQDRSLLELVREVFGPQAILYLRAEAR